MSTVAKIITTLIFVAFGLAILTHPAGFAGDATAGGAVLDNTLALESGQGSTGGTKGKVNGMTFS